MNGSLAFRNVLQGKHDGCPVFVPFIYGLAARTAHISLRDMVVDASYYANALEGVYRLLGHNVIVSNFDTTLESEALGSQVEWQGEYGAPSVVKEGDLSNLQPEDFMSRGRIPVLMDVTNRLAISLGREAAIACALTGPCSFVRSFPMLFGSMTAYSTGEAIKVIGNFFTKLVKGLCQLKVDALFFREDPLGQEFTEELFGHKEAYKALYATLFNIVRAFNGFPILVTRHLPVKAIRDVHALLKPAGMALLGDTFRDSDLSLIKDTSDSLRMSCGLALPIGTDTEERLWNRLSVMEAFVSGYKPKNLFYTSDGEIPHDIGMEILHSLMERLMAGSER
jgi:hypothetical protein